MTPLSVDISDLQVANDHQPVSPSSDADSASPQAPRHALDMLLLVLRNTDDSSNFPVEVRVNVCSFFYQLSKHIPAEELSDVKEVVRPVLESLVGNTEEMLEKAIQRVLDSWSV